MLQPLRRLLVSTAILIWVLLAHPVAAQTSGRITESHATISQSFSAAPAIGLPVTLSASVTSDFDIVQGTVRVTMPKGFLVSSASPPGYTSSDGVVTWTPLSLTSGTPYTFQVSGASQQAYIGWVDVRLDDQINPGQTITVGADSLAVKVTSTGAQTSETGQDIVPVLGPESDSGARYNEPIVGELTWSPFPLPGQGAAATIEVTNTSQGVVSFAGSFSLPAGWTVTQGSPTFGGVLAPGSSDSHTLSVQASSSEGRWQLPVTLSPTGGSAWAIVQHGYFSAGESYNLHQTWGPAGMSPLLVHAALPPMLPDQLVLNPKAVLPQQFAGCAPGEVRVHGQVTIQDSPGPASYLNISLWVHRFTQNGVRWDYQGQQIITNRLTQFGNYEVCFPLDGKAFVTYWINATDSTGLNGDEQYPWSTMVFAKQGSWMAVPGVSSGTREILTGGQPSNWCSNVPGGGLDCLWSLELNLRDQPDSAYLRLAAMHARDTRTFMMMPSGPGVGETRSPGWYRNGTRWRAVALANSDECEGCQLCRPRYEMGDGELRSGYRRLFIVGNHEFGHVCHWWRENEYSPPGCPTSPWYEGWADSFLAAISHMSLGEGISNYNGDRSIEVVEEGNPEFLGDGRLELAGSMLDFWDEQATEVHPGHNWDDPATGLWHEGWLNTDQTITEVCQFRVNWHAAGRPVAGETIMDHDGVLTCP